MKNLKGKQIMEKNQKNDILDTNLDEQVKK